MKMFKRLIAAVTAAFTMLTAVPITASAVTFTPTNGVDDQGKPVPIYLYSKSVFMIDLDSGSPITDINSDEKLAAGYLTQLMTCAIVLDEFKGNEKRLRESYVSGDSAAYDELFNTGAPTADIQPYEEVNYYDLLVSMILCSSCEAANIVATNLCESIFEFTIRMNNRASELGMNNTSFSSPHGLFTMQNYTTAKDMSILCRYLYNNYPVFSDICSETMITLEPTEDHTEGTNIYNNNLMINPYSPYYYKNASGIKVSSQEDSGRSMVSCASEDGSTYLIVTMGAPFEKTEADIKKGQNDPDSIYGDDYVQYNILDHTSLYRWAFGSLDHVDFINPNSEITDAKVEFGDGADYVNLKPSGGINILWPSDLETSVVKQDVTVYKNIIAPVEKGDVLGKLVLTYNGEVLKSVDLIATASIKRSKKSSTLRIAASYFRSNEFKWAVFIIVMLFSIYGIGYFLYLQLKYLKINKK